MAAVTIRGLSDEVHRALRVRAARHGRSTEPPGRFKLGTELGKIRSLLDGAELEIVRDETPVRAIDFEA